MDIKLIECKVIEFPKMTEATKGLRAFSKEFAEKLSVTIKKEGMHHAILIRPNPEKEGHYIGVQGRHRHYAKHKVLKEQFIECRIAEDMDDAEAEMAMITENLWRNPLTKGQQTLSIKRWFEHFQKLHPVETGSQTGAAQKALADKRAAKKADSAGNQEAQADEGGEAAQSQSAIVADNNDDASEGNTNEGGFTDRVAAATGKSKRTAERELRIAKAFTEEQLEVFMQMGVAATDQERIAKIKDEADRGAIVNLIASGMDAEEAINQAMGEKAPTPVNMGKEAAEAKGAAKQEKAPEMDDEQWFETYCGEKAKLLADPAKYKADALLYRKVVDARHAFRAKVKGAVKATKAGKIVGPFFHNLNRLISISHPKDWPLCGTCGGKGVKDDKKCPRCYGCCYEVKTEEYL